MEVIESIVFTIRTPRLKPKTTTKLPIQRSSSRAVLTVPRVTARDILAIAEDVFPCVHYSISARCASPSPNTLRVNGFAAKYTYKLIIVNKSPSTAATAETSREIYFPD